MTKVYFRVSDTKQIPICVTCSIEEFANAMQRAWEYKCGPGKHLAGYDYWSHVIAIATNGHYKTIPFGQRAELAKWIRENKRDLCAEYSKRAICTLNNLLSVLDPLGE